MNYWCSDKQEANDFERIGYLKNELALMTFDQRDQLLSELILEVYRLKQGNSD